MSQLKERGRRFFSPNNHLIPVPSAKWVRSCSSRWTNALEFSPENSCQTQKRINSAWIMGHKISYCSQLLWIEGQAFALNRVANELPLLQENLHLAGFRASWCFSEICRTPPLCSQHFSLRRSYATISSRCTLQKTYMSLASTTVTINDRKCDVAPFKPNGSRSHSNMPFEWRRNCMDSPRLLSEITCREVRNRRASLLFAQCIGEAALFVG